MSVALHSLSATEDASVTSLGLRVDRTHTHTHAHPRTEGILKQSRLPALGFNVGVIVGVAARAVCFEMDPFGGLK